MPVYDTISVLDYNNIRNIINPVLGTGSGTTGYGQTTLANTTVIGDAVSKSQWDRLRFDIVNSIVHQSGALPSIVIINEGDTISYDASQPNYQYLTLANQANTNRFDLGAGQYATETKATGSYTPTWQNSISTSFTVTFTDGNAARYFFNSGGKIRFASSFTPRISNPQNNAWQTLLSNMGTISFGATSPAVNFYSLTSSTQTFYTLASTSYTSNRINLKASCNVPSNASGGATVITFTVEWVDSYVDPDIISGHPATDNPPDGTVQGTTALTISQLRATGALYPDLVANSFSITSPTYSPITISGS
jgi:hypothetical protein